MNDTFRARLIRWLNTTSLPLPYELRTLILDVIVGSKLTRIPLPFGNCQIDLDLADSLQSNLYLDRVWEPDFSNWAAFFASRSRIIADVGAQIGYFTLLMAAYSQGGTIHAFEPNPSTFARLQQNIELNNTLAVLNCVAVANQNGESEFHMPHRFISGAARLGQLAHTQQTIPVRTTSLDHYLAQNELPAIDLVKMDIEGGEILALLGMKDGLLTGKYGVLLVEFHHQFLSPADLQTISNILQQSHYTLFATNNMQLVRVEQIRASHVCAVSPSALATFGIDVPVFRLPAEFSLPRPLTESA